MLLTKILSEEQNFLKKSLFHTSRNNYTNHILHKHTTILQSYYLHTLQCSYLISWNITHNNFSMIKYSIYKMMFNEKMFHLPLDQLVIATYCSIIQCDAHQLKNKIGLLSLLINPKFLNFLFLIFLGQGNNNINIKIIPTVC